MQLKRMNIQLKGCKYFPDANTFPDYEETPHSRLRLSAKIKPTINSVLDGYHVGSTECGVWRAEYSTVLHLDALTVTVLPRLTDRPSSSRTNAYSTCTVDHSSYPNM